MRTISETSRTILNAKHSNHRSPRRRRQKDHEKILEIIVEKFPKVRKEIAAQIQKNPESPKQDKSKVKPPKTHINQINKDQTQGANIKSSKRKAINNTQGDSNKDNS